MPNHGVNVWPSVHDEMNNGHRVDKNPIADAWDLIRTAFQERKKGWPKHLDVLKYMESNKTWLDADMSEFSNCRATYHDAANSMGPTNASCCRPGQDVGRG